MKLELTYTPALPTDARLLTETATSSKQTWGYSNDLMNLWKTDLEVNQEYIFQHEVIKVYDGDDFIGFFAIKTLEHKQAEIDHLWLLPSHIRKGYGRMIFHHILQHMKLKGFEKALLVAEPNAKGFYDQMGGVVTGQFQSKVNGRFLEIYEFKLDK